ncbi:Gfo/Idh/MocA family oxidoreductase [Actinoplanes sp. NPDC026619]|uniref:Gfo/Idh/MocA family protein n=1 Tax=Actinoplanes sp. NPDC026619 TaxID=3155798 RepID=UPI0033DBB507
MRYRVLMFGAGGMAHTWLSWFLAETADRCQVVGLVDADPVPLEKEGRERGLWPQACFGSIGAALAAVRDGRIQADCAFVVLPPEHHREAIVGAVDAGLHVLTEKPLAGSWEDCLAIAAADGGPAKIGVIQNYRYTAAAMTARRMLADRELGEPYFVSVRFRADYREFASWSGPARHRMASPLLTDAAVHHLDRVRYLTGLEFTEIACDEWRPPAADGFAGGCCVSLLGRLTGGVRVTYEANAVCGGEQRSWTGEEYRVECADGALVVLGEQLRVERHTGGELTVDEVALDPMPRRYHLYALDEFLDWLDGGRFDGPTVADNLQTMRAVTAALRAAGTHSWVRLDEIEEARP